MSALNAAAELILSGILRELPGVKPDDLRRLLGRVADLHASRYEPPADVRPEDMARMYPKGESRPQPPARYPELSEHLAILLEAKPGVSARQAYQHFLAVYGDDFIGWERFQRGYWTPMMYTRQDCLL